MTTAGAKSHFATVLPDTFGEPYPDASRYGEVETVEVNLEDVEAKIKTIGLQIRQHSSRYWRQISY